MYKVTYLLDGIQTQKLAYVAATNAGNAESALHDTYKQGTVSVISTEKMEEGTLVFSSGKY